MPLYRVPRLSLNGRAGSCELGDQLAMSKKRSQPLLGSHAVDVVVEPAAGSVGQLRSHVAM
jgi:hypothetical protein